ncbi:27150_t:CDS:2, partial [Gigaspora margarita]
ESCLKGIKKYYSTPKQIIEFVEKLLEYNNSEEFRIARDICEQSFKNDIQQFIANATLTLKEMVRSRSQDEVTGVRVNFTDSDIKNLYSLSDEDDLNLEQLSSEFELMKKEEIQSYNSKELPELSDNLLEFLLKFDKDTLEELKNVLLEQEAWEGNNYNKVTHFDLKWIKKSICDLVNEYENDNIKYGCHENWYIIHFWSLIDHSLSDLDLYDARGEVSSLAKLAVMLMRLDSPNGYTCRITRSPLYHLAEDVKNFEKNLEILVLTLKAKAIVKKTISLV